MSELQFEPLEDRGREELALWLASDEWPFHLAVRPGSDRARQWVSGGRFTGKDNRTFWVLHPSASEPIGLLALHELSDPTPVFDIRLATKWRGRSHGREAMSWLAEYVFGEAAKNRIEGHTRFDNIPMRRLFRACSWVKEAHHRQAWPDASGRFHDAVTYALLRDDWKRGTTTPVNWTDEP